MQYINLGKSQIQVSQVCLGTMTWGGQNSQQQAFEQLDYALSQGINFIDTAEMYSIPPKPETSGSTETIIGNWLSQDPSRRDKVILASKAVGPGINWIREGSPLTKETVKHALEQSLTRLKTDYLDLYQIHWPNRNSPHFGKHWPNRLNLSAVDSAEQTDMMLAILEALDESIKAGKIRACGLSNETPWGINQFLKLSEAHNLARIVSIQNEFNLLHLKDNPYVLETCINEGVSYLPWSPLAGGALTGKYVNGARPNNTRWSMVQRNGLFRDTLHTDKAIIAFKQVADKYKLNLGQMALAYIYQFEGVSSTIIGATSVEQLKQNIQAYSMTLEQEVIDSINQVIKSYPMPF
ncbi:aldo/keto reductase [Catenovulum maritimum]|nr:aldo/keto reductase [Catenovulum maritimum]